MEDTRAKEEAIVQPESVPSSEDTQASEVENSEAALPDDASDRTKREFEKLRSQLADERQKRMQSESVFDSIRMKPQANTGELGNLYDPNTNLVDIAALEQLRIKTLSAEERATRAERTVERYVEEQQTKEALAVHPELDPSKKGFNQTLYKATRAILLDSMVNPQDYDGRQLSYKAAADLAKSVNNKVVADAERQGATKAIEGLSSKEQAALEATGRSDGRSYTEDSDDLAYRTQKGDVKAIMERLKRIPTA